MDINMDKCALVKELFEDNAEQKPLPILVNQLNTLLQCKLKTLESVTSGLVNTEFLDEVKVIVEFPIYFGKTLRDLKCIILDDNLREHELCFHYNGPKNLTITNIAIPHSTLHDQVFSSIREIAVTFKKHLDDLKDYFYQLEQIDRFCTVKEPREQSFKYDYRRIQLDDRTCLHVEVTPGGLATNIHLVGQSDVWTDKLQVGLLAWDHDKDIVENIFTIFDLVNYPLISTSIDDTKMETDKDTEDTKVCNICLCAELDDAAGPLQLFCQNPTCGVTFHKSCLYQWLVTCSGDQPSGIGIVSGKCPTCLKSISMNYKE